MEHGRVRINLDKLMEEKGFSVKRLSRLADMERDQIKKYRDQKRARYDADILARLCYALECDISDLLEYIPAKKEEAAQ